jgi:hypothetical protein
MDLVLNMNLTIMTLISFKMYYFYLFMKIKQIKINKNNNRQINSVIFMFLPLLNTHLRDFYPKKY